MQFFAIYFTKLLYNLQLTDEETEAQRLSNLSPNHTNYK